MSDSTVISQNLRTEATTTSFFQYAAYNNKKCPASSLDYMGFGALLNSCLKTASGNGIKLSATASGTMTTLSYQAYYDSACSTTYGTPVTVESLPNTCTKEGKNVYEVLTTVSTPPTSVDSSGVAFGIYNSQTNCQYGVATALQEFAYFELNICQTITGFSSSGAYILTGCSGTPGAYTVNYEYYKSDTCSGSPKKTGTWTTAANTCNNDAYSVNGIAYGYLNAKCVYGTA